MGGAGADAGKIGEAGLGAEGQDNAVGLQGMPTEEVPVTGTIPPMLTGWYLHNGPNPRDAASGHWFADDGMVHGVRLENGRATSSRNRWVPTHSFTRGAFFHEYNYIHRHSGIAWHTPASVHFGTSGAVDQAGQNTLTAAYHAHPERFSRRPHPPVMPAQPQISGSG